MNSRVQRKKFLQLAAEAGRRAPADQAETKSPSALGAGAAGGADLAPGLRDPVSESGVRELIGKLRGAVDEIKPVEQQIARNPARDRSVRRPGSAEIDARTAARAAATLSQTMQASGR